MSNIKKKILARKIVYKHKLERGGRGVIKGDRKQ